MHILFLYLDLTLWKKRNSDASINTNYNLINKESGACRVSVVDRMI